MRLGLRVTLAFAFFGATLVAGGATAATKGNWFNMYPLISDTAGGTALRADASLVNGWGLSAGPTTPWWTSNNGTNTSTLYSGAGVKSALTVSVPGGPTGTVFNGNATAFAVSRTARAARRASSSRRRTGQILGWSPTVNGTVAVTAVDNSSQGRALRRARDAQRPALCDGLPQRAASTSSTRSSRPSRSRTASSTRRSRRAGRRSGSRRSAGTSSSPTRSRIRRSARTSPAAGWATSTSTRPTGALARVAKRGLPKAPLNSPWGLAMAPATFGGFAGDLLVGNFGNGKISVYQPPAIAPGKWVYKGQLRVATGEIIKIPGLWAIAFGNGGASGPDEQPLLPRRAERARSPGCSASSRSAEDTAADLGPRAVCPDQNVPVPQVEVRRELAG